MKFEVLTDSWGHTFDKGTIVSFVRRESDTLAWYDDVKTGTRQLLSDYEVEPVLDDEVTTIGTSHDWKKKSYSLNSDHNQERNTKNLTVGDLREAVKNLPEDLPVVVWVDGTNRAVDAVEILDVSYEPDLNRLDLEIYLEEED